MFNRKAELVIAILISILMYMIYVTSEWINPGNAEKIKTAAVRAQAAESKNETAAVSQKIKETEAASEAEKKQIAAAEKEQVSVSASSNIAQQKAEYPALSSKDSWSMVIVPDTQTYVKQIENQGILDMMLAWIVRRRNEMKIQQVLFTGDLVYANNHHTVNRPDGIRFARGGGLRDLIADEQWKAFSRLVARLDGEVPYVLCTGNHDYGFSSAENRKTNFNKFFPVDRNPLTRRQLISCGFNSFDVNTLENSAYELTAPHPDGRKFLIITLQFAPTDRDLKWAKKIADNPKYADHIGIVLTHSYIFANGERIKSEKYALNKKGGNPGEAIFQKLIYPAKNIRMVICGHVCKPDDWSRSVGFSMVQNSSGKSVAQMVFNTQAIGGGFSGNGGDGWLRILEFMPDRKTVKATTFSPFFFSSPSTWHLAWKTDERNSFSFTID